MARKGKYSAVINTLPRLDGVEPERRDLVETVKSEILAPPSRDTSEDPQVFETLTAEIESDIKTLLGLIKTTTGNCHDPSYVARRRYASEFARAYATARDLRDKMDEWRSSANLLVEAFQALMVDQMEQEGISSMKLTSGRPITTFMEPYAQVQDREAFRQWCLQDPDLARKMALPWMSTNALVKERLLAGEPEPPGVTCFAKTVVRLGSE